ncbi:UNVERIFIED_CONTAM: hypothetical protein K2H54_004670 [Gekko kuhli]
MTQTADMIMPRAFLFGDPGERLSGAELDGPASWVGLRSLRAMQEWLFADHLKMASFVVAVLDGPDRHPYPGTALTIRVEEWLFADHLKMASFVVAVLDGPDRHPYPGTALTIRVEPDPGVREDDIRQKREASRDLLGRSPWQQGSVLRVGETGGLPLLAEDHPGTFAGGPACPGRMADGMALHLAKENSTGGGVPEYVRVFGYTTFQAMLERGTRSPQPGAHPPAPEGRQPHCRREGRQQDASSPGC